jgi:hypothetical protein
MNNYQVNAQDGWDLRTKSEGYADACYFKDSKASILPDGGGTLNINKESGYGVIYDNCARVITGHPGVSFKNDPAKHDKEFDAATYVKGSWVPTQTWSGYYVNNHDKAEDVPAICEKYSGAGKIEIWKEYASQVPAYSQTNLQTALDNPRTIASSGQTYYTYDAQGNKMTKAPAPTAISEVQEAKKFNSSSVQKSIVNGKLVIIKDGKQFNAAGAQVQ